MGTPKSSILIGFPIINHPFWGTPIFGNTQISSKNGDFPWDPNLSKITKNKQIQVGQAAQDASFPPNQNAGGSLESLVYMAGILWDPIVFRKMFLVILVVTSTSWVEYSSKCNKPKRSMYDIFTYIYHKQQLFM